MDKKIRLLIVSLGIISLLVVILAIWVYFSAQIEVGRYAQREKQLKGQCSLFEKKVDTAQKDVRLWQEKSQSITSALDRLSKEHTLLQNQYDSLLKEKDSLVQENKNVSVELERVNKLYTEAKKRKTEKPKIGTSDKFLSSLLKEKAEKEAKVERLEAKIDSQQARIEEAQDQIKPYEQQVQRLQKEIENLGQGKQSLEEKLQDAQKVSDILSSDLLQEKKKRTALEKDLAKTEKHLGEIAQEKDKLSDQLVKMKQALEQRLTELDRTKEVLQGAVEGAKKVASERESTSIQLPPIVVKADALREKFSAETELEEEILPLPKGFAKAEKEIEEILEVEGSIITVNDKHKFVVIDIGSDEGVDKGMKFNVYRRNKKVGKIEVIETRKNISACDIKELGVKNLRVNDSVRR